LIRIRFPALQFWPQNARRITSWGALRF
jgi:hypothetical protein